MKIIQLSRGQVALVDDEDYEELSKYKWSCSLGYAVRAVEINGKRTSVRMHRQIMGVSNDVDIDHKNLIKFDNQKHNLRIATKRQNRRNVNTKNKNFVAAIKTEEKSFYLGSYESSEDAAKAYDIAAIKLFGEFAWVNGVDISTPPKKWVRRPCVFMTHKRALSFQNKWGRQRALKIIELATLMNSRHLISNFNKRDLNLIHGGNSKFWKLLGEHCEKSGLTLQY